jgi:hypothetical protein
LLIDEGKLSLDENIYNIALYTVKSFSNNAIPDTTWD